MIKPIFKIILGFIFCLNWNTTLAQTVFPHPDNSVETSIFYEMRLPDIEQVWTAEEYKKALKLIENIKKEDKYSLPRSGSPYSAEVFAQVVNPKNLAILEDRTLPMEKRLYNMQVYSSFPSQLMSIYREPLANTERFGKEIIDIYFFAIQFSNKAVGIVNDAIATNYTGLTKSDLDHAMEVVQDYHDNIVEELLELFITKKERYDQQLLDNLSNELVGFLPEVWPQLSVQQQKALKADVKKLSKDKSHRARRKAFRQLFKKL